jgi:hypothetical protein
MTGPRADATRPPAHRTPGRGARLAVACGMAAWTLLQTATLVVAAARGGQPSDAMRFAVTGVVCVGLAALTTVAWRWAGRRAVAVPDGPATYQEGPALGPGSAPDDVPPARHAALSGEAPPPRRW